MKTYTCRYSLSIYSSSTDVQKAVKGNLIQVKNKQKNKYVNGFTLSITALLFFMSLCVSNILNAQSLTVKEQLIALNKEWKKADTKEAFFSSQKSFDSEVELIQTHLARVETNLRNKDVSHLNVEQQTKRNEGLQLLHDYWTKGVFPKNTFHEKRTPYFIDIFGTYCAVGYLIKETGFDALAQRIHREHNYGYINDLKTLYPEIGNWAKEYGFSTDELAWIQPTYGPYLGYYNCFSPTYSTQFTVIPASCQNLCNGNIIVPTHNPWSLQPIVATQIIPASVCGNLCVGVYTIVAVDASNYSTSIVMYVGIDAPPVTVDIQAVTCNAPCNGAIGFDSIAGNQNPTQYRLYQNGNLLSTQNTPLFNSLCAGTYNLGFSVPNGCSWNYGPYTINQGTLLNSNANISNAILCHGDSGLVQVSAIGGNPPYTGIGTFPVVAGTHIFQVTDANNCLSIDTLLVNQPAPLILSNYVSTPIACYGDSASVILYANGGTPPYNGVGTFQLPAGTHNFSINDANNCISSNTFTVNQPDPLVLIDSIITPILCHGDSGLVQVSAIGGNPPYTGIGTFPVVAGTHIFQVTDANNCLSIDTLLVNQPAPLILSNYVSTPIACYGDSASVILYANGGTPPYNGVGTFQLPAGTHNFSINDANNCISSNTFTVNQPDPLVLIDSIITPILCHGDSALLQISGSGGTLPYTGIGNFSYPAGTYTISISDTNNCTTTTNILLSEPQALSLNLSMIPDNGTNNGTAVCNPLGGTPPYTYTWNTGGTTDAIFNLGTGWYTCVLSDANGCTKTDSIFVSLQFPQGLSETQNTSLRISPNPTKDYLKLDFIEKQHLVETHLRNLSGQTLSKQTASETAHIQLDLRAYPRGIYVLEIRSNNEIKYVKVVKE